MVSLTTVDRYLKINETLCCPFGSLYGFPYRHGFQTIHPLNLKSLVEYGQNPSTKTICSGHLNDLKKYFASEFPHLVNKPKMFQRYLKLEMTCLTHNLIQALNVRELLEGF